MSFAEGTALLDTAILDKTVLDQSTGDSNPIRSLEFPQIPYGVSGSRVSEVPFPGRENHQVGLLNDADSAAYATAKVEGTKLSWIERRCRQLLFRQLEQITTGQIIVQDSEGLFRFGVANSTYPPATVRVTNPAAYRRFVFGGDLGFADSLIDGDFQVDNLVALLRILVDSNRSAEGDLGRPSMVRRFWSRLQHWMKRNHRANSRKNIQAHYDLSNEFFSLWLDPTWSYSSGVFPKLRQVPGPTGLEWQSEASMETASLIKLERICEKLELSSSDHLLEIGCGWGGLAVFAASKYGCRVTGVTLSQAQLEVAQARVAEAGLADLVTLKLQDYRDIEGQFDKLVSVEMIEAVGHQFQDEYFRTCCQLLKPTGRMVLQGITIVDFRYEDYLKSVDFIREYVFPGGSLISTSGIMRSVARHTDFRLAHIEDIGPHYAETLRRWRSEFHRQWPKIAQLGFDARFFRLWDYYLAYCEAGFAEGHVGTVQVVLDRPKCLRPVAIRPSI
ncbi:MAG: class I SAM-dependent methyltransferase [Planctomycetaceae bacterium]|nr:class I SAM-dependent methyltransferase [Planctomycetaceae bacterium]